MSYKKREFVELWDAGEMGCGELVMELKFRINNLAPDALLKVIARDLGAIEDLPSWCRLTGNELVQAEHPVYVIRKL